MRNRITFLDFNNALKDFPVFSTADILKDFPHMHRRRLHEWVQRGLLRHVVKGYYSFESNQVNESFIYLAANRIYQPSYISLQSALSWYGLIPEFVPQVTCVSTKKTTTLNTGFGSFSYFSVKHSLMFGYTTIPSHGYPLEVKMAYPEKAILDFLYLNPQVASKEQFVELRLHQQVYKEKIQPEVLARYLELFANKALTKRVVKLTEYLENA